MIKKIFNFKNITILCLILLLFITFMTNFMNNDNIGIHNFEKFQYDSEALVINKMDYNKKERDEICDYGLCIKFEENGKYGNYTSQVGLQGYIFSFVNNTLKMSVKTINKIVSLILAIVLVALSYFMTKKYDKLLGIIFYITFLLSPWIIAFARNLYWVSFTWFIPCLLGLLLSLNYDKKRIFVPLIFLAIFVKCLCGYEYITTIMLSTIIFFIVDFFLTNDKTKKKKIFNTTIIVGIVCLLGFLAAITIHGYMRGNGNVFDGVKTIYKNDVLRRTIITTDKDSYSGVIKDSIEASVFEVLDLYYNNWTTDILYGINNNLFPVIAFGAFAICIINILTKTNNSKRDIIMYICFLSTSISWFVLGKSHSYIHTHMNFVLWYFGFIQICIYIFVKYFNNIIINQVKKVTKS